MTPWRLEVLRLTRTGRLAALLGVFVLLGLAAPLLTRYLDRLLELFQDSLGGALITVPEPTAVAALQGFEKNAAQIGIIVLVVVAASAVAVDSSPQVGVFFRTRVRSTWAILLPRVLITTAAATLAATAGLLAAWYETAVLIEPVPPAAVLVGSIAFGLLNLFVVTLTAVWAQVLRGTLGAVLGALCTLILLPVLGLLPPVAAYLPTTLAAATSALTGAGSPQDLLPAAVVAVVASLGLFIAAAALMHRREPTG